MQQGLVLPGPGLALLVFLEAGQVRDREPALAAGPQPHVHLVEPASGGVDGQQVHESLAEAIEEDGVVDHLGPRRLLHIAARIVEEDQVEIRGVAELPAPQLAVADRRETRRPQAAGVATARLAVDGGQLVPGQSHGPVQYQFSDIGQAVADDHQRHAARQVQEGHAESGRAPEMPQRVDLPLQVAARLLEPRIEFPRELPAIRQFDEYASVDQLVEQYREGRHLAREEVAMPADLDQPLQRLGILIEQ